MDQQGPPRMPPAQPNRSTQYALLPFISVCDICLPPRSSEVVGPSNFRSTVMHGPTIKALGVPNTLPEKNMYTYLCIFAHHASVSEISIFLRFLIQCDAWTNRTRLGCHLHSPTDQLNHAYHSSASVISVCLLDHQRSLVHPISEAL